MSTRVLAYWTQRADFSSVDHTPVDLDAAEEILRSHDWSEELRLLHELGAIRKLGDYCSPGIGFEDPEGRLLHVIKEGDGTMTCFHTSEPKSPTGGADSRAFWFADAVPDLVQYRLLQLFYRGDTQGIRKLLKPLEGLKRPG